MKKTNKFISLLISIIMLMQFTAMNVSAQSLDRTVVSDTYYDAAKVVYDLGIMPDVYTNYSKNVTRGDFAVVLTKIIGLTEYAEALKDTQIFNDIEVGTYLNGCAKALCDRGYMSAVSSGVFEPDTEMAFQDIVKVLVTVLGYEPLTTRYGEYAYPTDISLLPLRRA